MVRVRVKIGVLVIVSVIVDFGYTGLCSYV